MADFDVQKLAEEAARAQYRSRTDLDGFDRLIARQKRSWVEDSTAALAVIVPAVTEQIRALHQQRNIREYEERDCADGICDGHYDDISGAEWCPSRIVSVCSRCYSIAAEDVEAEVYEWPCEHVRLLDELDAAARGEQP